MMIANILSPVSLLDYIQWGGVIGLLLAFIVALQKKWIVMGWQYKAIEESNAKWMELALRSTNLATSLDEMRKELPLPLK